MFDWLFPFTFWHWLTVGLLFGVLEMLLPGFVLLWFGAGSAVTAIVLGLFPDLGWKYQLIIFSVTSLTALVLWRKRLQTHPTVSDDPQLNQRGAQYIGRSFVVSEAISNGVGRVNVGESSWRARGPDTAEGESVRVVGVEGATLIVELQ